MRVIVGVEEEASHGEDMIVVIVLVKIKGDEVHLVIAVIVIVGEIMIEIIAEREVALDRPQDHHQDLAAMTDIKRGEEVLQIVKETRKASQQWIE